MMDQQNQLVVYEGHRGDFHASTNWKTKKLKDLLDQISSKTNSIL